MFGNFNRKTDSSYHVAGKWKGNSRKNGRTGPHGRGQEANSSSAKKGAPQYDVQM